VRRRRSHGEPGAGRRACDPFPDTPDDLEIGAMPERPAAIGSAGGGGASPI
jgi:hypothetical protein